MKGRGALIELSKRCSADEGWKDLDTEEENWLIANLVKAKEDKTTKKNVTYAATDIQGTLARVDPEVSIQCNHNSVILTFIPPSSLGCQSERMLNTSMASCALRPLTTSTFVPKRPRKSQRPSFIASSALLKRLS